MIVLDCSLRDGGYHCNWEFSLKLADEYLCAMEKAGVQAVEIGFRSPPKKPVGLFAKATDELFEEKLVVPDIKYLGVMVNADEMSPEIIKKLFSRADISPINLVRVATHFEQLASGEKTCKNLKDLGYTVCCNLMQAAGRSFDEIRNAAKKVSNWEAIDVLYLADSLGNMDHDAVNYAYRAIREGWDGLTGFHAHNNKGQALNNSLEAIDIGVDWIDSTILGMGRGAGNTETEYLLNELNKRGSEFELEEIYKLALSEFLPLKQWYKWGPSLLYYLAAEFGIHPTFIQEMLCRCYEMDKNLKAVYFLKDMEASRFNKDLLNRALDG